MTNFIARLLRRTATQPRGGAYAVAMSESGALLRRMEEAQRSSDPVRAVMADIWRQRNNMPFVATVHEAVAEMNAPFVGTTARAPESKT